MPVSKRQIQDSKLTESSTKEDLESLLKLAEELKDKCDLAESDIEKKKNITLIRLGINLSSIIFVALAVFVYFRYSAMELIDQANANIAIFFISIFLSLFLIFIIGINYTSQVTILRKKINLDKLALKEVLQLLRETSSITANNENWSILSRAEFRIRLSRFNLEESKSSDSLFGIFDDTLKVFSHIILRR